MRDSPPLYLESLNCHYKSNISSYCVSGVKLTADLYTENGIYS